MRHHLILMPLLCALACGPAGDPTEEPTPAAQSPRETPTASPSESPTLSPTATQVPQPTPTGTASPTPTDDGTAGIPQCVSTSGDQGGFRFSKDGGKSLADNARALSGVAYTWDLDIHPENANEILELHEGVLFRSEDAGCTFERATLRTLNYDQIRRAPSDPNFIVLTSIFNASLAVSEDNGRTWVEESAPTVIYDLAIDPADPWHWTLIGQGPNLYFRHAAGAKWESRPIPLPGGASVVNAHHHPNAYGRWVVGSYDDIMISVNSGQSWQLANTGLDTDLGDPEVPVITRVPASFSFAPGDPNILYMALNSATLDQNQRALWRSDDGGASWQKRVIDDDWVGDVQLNITGGTRVFVDPADADHVLFAFGTHVSGYGTDLFRSDDGLQSLAVQNFKSFHDLFALQFGPAGSQHLFLGISYEAVD